MGDSEWTGKWGDKDMARPENARVRQQTGFVNDADDGIFWIGFEDFTQEYAAPQSN